MVAIINEAKIQHIDNQFTFIFLALYAKANIDKSIAIKQGIKPKISIKLQNQLLL